MKTTAKELKPGDAFRLPSKRKFRTVKVVDTLSLARGDKMPKQFDGKLLVVFDTCKQIVLSPDDEIILRTKAENKIGMGEVLAASSDDPPLHWAIQLRRILLIGWSTGTTHEDLIRRIEKHNAFLRDVTGLLETGDMYVVKLMISNYFNEHIATPKQ
jgi:hypothetical protein